MQPAATLPGPSSIVEQRFGNGFFNRITRQLGRIRTGTTFPGAATMKERREWILADLDLEPILVKAMDAEEGHGWTLDFASRVSRDPTREPLPKRLADPWLTSPFYTSATRSGRTPCTSR